MLDTSITKVNIHKLSISKILLKFPKGQRLNISILQIIKYTDPHPQYPTSLHPPHPTPPHPPHPNLTRYKIYLEASTVSADGIAYGTVTGIVKNILTEVLG